MSLSLLHWQQLARCIVTLRKMAHASGAAAASTMPADAVSLSPSSASAAAAPQPIAAAIGGAGTPDAAEEALAAGPKATGDAAAAPSRPDCYLIVSSVAKKLNVGMVVRSATAFGARELIVTGGPARLSTLGAQGTERFLRVRCVPRLRDAVAQLKAEGVTICGIEITPGAAPVQAHPFRGHTAFLAGAEGSGLPEAHKALCDHFVYIPQYGNGTASLNVTVATSIVLHHFAVWAGYSELPREDVREKFVVVPPAAKFAATTADDFEKQAQRRAQRAAAQQNAEGAPALAASLLACDEDGNDEDNSDHDGEFTDDAHSEADAGGQHEGSAGGPGPQPSALSDAGRPGCERNHVAAAEPDR